MMRLLRRLRGKPGHSILVFREGFGRFEASHCDRPEHGFCNHLDDDIAAAVPEDIREHYGVHSIEEIDRELQTIRGEIEDYEDRIGDLRFDEEELEGARRDIEKAARAGKPLDSSMATLLSLEGQGRHAL